MDGTAVESGTTVDNPLDIEAAGNFGSAAEYPDVSSHLYTGPFEWCMVCRGTEKQLQEDVQRPLTSAGLACHIS